MGQILSGILGTNNDYRYNNGGQNYAQNAAQAQINLGNLYNNQNSLAQALLAQSNGVGANPAQAMLNQTTDRNIKDTASMIASQKGINPGLAQRLIAQNGAQAQQNAAAQGATMNAQQQLAAQGQLSGLYGNMANQQLSSQGLAQGGMNAENQVNSGVAAANQSSQNQLLGSVIGAGAAAMGHGATSNPTPNVQNHYDGGVVTANAPNPNNKNWNEKDKKDFTKGFTAGPDGDPLVQAVKKLFMSHGGNVPGTPEVEGDSPKNDNVPALLSPGEIVIPRSKSSDPAKAKAFLDEVMKKNGTKKDDEGKAATYADILKIKNQLKELEKKVKKQ